MLTELEKQLQQALKHLYDPSYLGVSPLIGLLGLGERRNSVGVLRDTLVSAVEALKPAQDSAVPRKAHEYYQALFYRCVQGLTQQEVADRLGVSPRQVGRLQQVAVRLLAERLSEKWPAASEALTLPECAARAGAGTPSAHEGDMNHELAWLADTMEGKWTDIGAALEEALNLARPVATAHAVHLDMPPCPTTSAAALPATVLTQLVLNLVTAAIRAVSGGCVSLIVSQEGERILIRVEALASESMAKRLVSWDPDATDVSRRLAGVFKGDLATSASSGVMSAQVWLPAGKEVVVLAVEDNADTLKLWGRYLEGSRFRLTAVEASEQTLKLATQTQPDVIILDVMMPGVDGWKLLAQLQEHPATRTIPVIVSTILPQEELALSLGARAFIRKPTTRLAFRQALERQIAVAELG